MYQWRSQDQLHHHVPQLTFLYRMTIRSGLSLQDYLASERNNEVEKSGLDACSVRWIEMRDEAEAHERVLVAFAADKGRYSGGSLQLPIGLTPLRVSRSHYCA